MHASQGLRGGLGLVLPGMIRYDGILLPSLIPLVDLILQLINHSDEALALEVCLFLRAALPFGDEGGAK